MIRRSALTLSAVVGVGVLVSGQAGTLTPQTAHQGLGQVATVCGMVIGVRCESPDSMVRLDFATPGDALGFSAQVAPPDRAKFGPNLEDRYQFQRACVTGTIEKYRGEHRIIVSHPDQLQVREKWQRTAPSVPGSADYHRPCDPGVTPPRLVRDVKPSYTGGGRNRRIYGTIVLQGVVRENGLVSDIRVVRSLGPYGYEQDYEAMKAFRQWRFKPGTLQGKIVPVLVTVEMAFRPY